MTIPSSTAYKDFVEIIQKLPDYDKPAFFGLPANIERSSQRMISQVRLCCLFVLLFASLFCVHVFDYTFLYVLLCFDLDKYIYICIYAIYLIFNISGCDISTEDVDSSAGFCEQSGFRKVENGHVSSLRFLEETQPRS